MRFNWALSDISLKQKAQLVSQSVNVSLNTVAWYSRFIWKECSVHDLQPARKRHWICSAAASKVENPIEIVPCSNCTAHRTPPCVSMARCVCVCECVQRERERGREGEGRDVTGENLSGRVAAVIPAEQSAGSGGERSDTKPERDHIVVCQTSAFLANPHSETLIIPSCCSPSLCLSLSLMLIHPPPPHPPSH